MAAPRRPRPQGKADRQAGEVAAAAPPLWVPQPGPQTLLCQCPVPEIFFGGARGGGKSDGLLGEWYGHAMTYGAKARGIMVRREGIQLEDIIARSQQLYGPAGWQWNAGKNFWTSKEGAVLRFRHLWDETAAGSYLGHAYTRVYAEELTNWPTPKPLLLLMATLRSAHGVPVGFRASGNPGGPGHNWVKSRYIDPAPPLVPIRDEKTAQMRVFIPSLLLDNPALYTSDPTYALRLLDVGSEALVKAWLEGDWNIVAGGALDDLWGPHVVCRPFQVPRTWRVSRSFDWGSSKPYACLWWARADGEKHPGAPGLPRGYMVLIGELYGTNGKANEGTRELAVEVGRKILAAEKDLDIAGRVAAGPADSAIFATENGKNIADDFRRVGVNWTEAEKGPGSRAAGLERVRQRLKASKQRPREEPGLLIFDTCRHALRTLPTLPRDPLKPDDVDSDAEDHVYDALRYALTGSGRSAVTVRQLKR